MQSFTSSFFGRAVAVVIVLTCAPRAAPCQGQPILARLDGPSTVVLVDPVTSRERRLYDASPRGLRDLTVSPSRSEEHTSELQSQSNLVCRLLLEKKKNTD